MSSFKEMQKEACLLCPLIYVEPRTTLLGLTTSGGKKIGDGGLLGSSFFICFYESRAVKHKVKIYQ